MIMVGPRYPDLRVTVHSRNPLALVAAVREALRLARVDKAEIQRFSRDALQTRDRRDVLKVCTEWAIIDSPV